MLAKTGYRAKKLEIIKKFPQEVQQRIAKVIGPPENLINTSNMFSAAVDARKKPDSNITELWMQLHQVPKPAEDSTLLMISRFLMDNIGASVIFTFFLPNFKFLELSQFFVEDSPNRI